MPPSEVVTAEGSFVGAIVISGNIEIGNADISQMTKRYWAEAALDCDSGVVETCQFVFLCWWDAAT